MGMSITPSFNWHNRQYSKTLSSDILQIFPVQNRTNNTLQQRYSYCQKWVVDSNLGSIFHVTGCAIQSPTAIFKCPRKFF